MQTHARQSWLLGGVLLGLCGVVYVAFFVDRNKEGLVFLFVLLPMLVALFFAGAANALFWMATKRSIRSLSNEPDLMQATLTKAESSGAGRMFVAIYRILQAVTMFVAGYISVCWVIGIILLDRV